MVELENLIFGPEICPKLEVKLRQARRGVFTSRSLFRPATSTLHDVVSPPTVAVPFSNV